VIPCVAGLFIGVDRYVNLRNQASLLAASASAARLHSYLKSSFLNGSWELLVESAERVPDRSEIIEAISNWVQAVKDHNAGLLYYAGHGKFTREGLILFPRDFRPSIPFDSGIPLQRIFEIIKIFGNHQAHYTVMVDACRVGRSSSNVIDIPSNVSVIYACQAGSVTAENSKSSLFIGFLLRALNDSETVPLGLLLTARLETVVTNLKRELAGSVERNYVNLEVSGAIGSVLIPVSPLIEVGEFGGSFPECLLKSRPITAETYELVLKHVAQCMTEMGIPPGQEDEYILPGDMAFDSSSNGTKKRSITVRLPPTSRFYPTSALLNLLLSRCHACFETLSLEWSGHIRKGKFYVITGRNKATLSLQTDGSIYVWEEQRCKGQAAISWAGKKRTTVELSCFSSEGFRLGLEWLMPTLDEVFSFLVRIPTGE
jgi:hypothetical protein